MTDEQDARHFTQGGGLLWLLPPFKFPRDGSDVSAEPETVLEQIAQAMGVEDAQPTSWPHGGYGLVRYVRDYQASDHNLVIGCTDSTGQPVFSLLIGAGWDVSASAANPGHRVMMLAITVSLRGYYGEKIDGLPTGRFKGDSLMLERLDDAHACLEQLAAVAPLTYWLPPADQLAPQQMQRIRSEAAERITALGHNVIVA